MPCRECLLPPFLRRLSSRTDSPSPETTGFLYKSNATARWRRVSSTLTQNRKIVLYLTKNSDSNTASPDCKALSRFATGGPRVWRVVLPTFRCQSRFLIGLCLIARDCEGNVSLRRQFRFVNRLRIEVKSGARFGMAKQSLNRLHIFALVNQKSRKAVTEVVEAESLTRFKPDANLNGGRTDFILRHPSGPQRRFAFHLGGRENPILGLRIECIPMPALKSVGQQLSEWDRSG